MQFKVRTFALTLPMLWISSACTPTVFLIDRQTVLELEASGDWQELDKDYQTKELQSGPIPLESTRETRERRPTLSMTHDDNQSTHDVSATKRKGP